MRILMLTNVVAPDKAGGLERYVRELSSELVARGDTVVVAAKAMIPTAPKRESGSDGVTVLRYAVPSKGRMAYALQYPLAVYRGATSAIAELRRDGYPPDVVHAHFPLPALALAVRKSPYLYTFHAPVHKELLGERQGSYLLPGVAQRAAVSALRSVESLVLRRASRVLCLSEFTRSEAIELGADPRKIVVVPGGLRVDQFLPNLPGLPAKQNDGPRLFAARRLVHRTGVEELVEAVSLVTDRLPEVTLKVAGEGPRRSHIEELIQRLRLTERVHLLGRVTEDELRRCYAEADICVTPTQQLEGFGLATAEAMASGACPLVTPIGANPEVVGTLGPACVTKDETPRALADGIVRLWSDAGSRLQAQARGPEVAAAFAWPVVAARIRSIYAEVANLTTATSQPLLKLR